MAQSKFARRLKFGVGLLFFGLAVLMAWHVWGRDWSLINAILGWEHYWWEDVFVGLILLLVTIEGVIGPWLELRWDRPVMPMRWLVGGGLHDWLREKLGV